MFHISSVFLFASLLGIAHWVSRAIGGIGTSISHVAGNSITTGEN